MPNSTPDCPLCGHGMRESSGDLYGLDEPAVTIRGVPAFFCRPCRICRFSIKVVHRLAVLVRAAMARAEEDGVRVISWTFTAEGHPDLSGFPAEIRASFAVLRYRIREERRLMDASRAAATERPQSFH